MGMDRELAQLAGVRKARRNRWYGPGITVCLAELDTNAGAWKQPVNWDKALGWATVLAVVALVWTASGFAVAYFLR
jgi:hypothetical protein